MCEMSDMYKLLMAMRLAKRERVGLGLTYFDVIELLGEFDSLKSRIAELEAERRWIPVTERLPRDGEYVLAAFTDTILTATYHRQWTGFVGLDDWLDIEGRHSGTPTHWMPLPPNLESPNDTQTQTIVYGKESEE